MKKTLIPLLARTKYGPYNNYYVVYYFDTEYQEVSRGYNQENFDYSCRCVKH